jgi:A/G-specific adenine glycosylase
MIPAVTGPVRQTPDIDERQFAPRLLAWFETEGRKGLPWQQNPSAYRVWVSEVMLQQTQVAAVVPYFNRFMQRFPTLQALAQAPLDEVLHQWTGLGYYARARNLQACAKVLMDCYGGEFPDQLDEVVALPGIGRSTAGAILSLSRGERHPILDGNAKRVLARVFGIAGDPGTAAVLAELWRRAEQCTPSARVAAYTQAIMDLGATVCRRSRPACGACPMGAGCVAARDGKQQELPGKRRKGVRAARESVLVIAETGDHASRAILLERRPNAGIWGGLWSPPQFDDEPAARAWCERELHHPQAALPALPPIDHAFTHFDLRLHPLRMRCAASMRVEEGQMRLWYRLSSPPQVGLPQPIRALFERLRSELRVT